MIFLNYFKIFISRLIPFGEIKSSRELRSKFKASIESGCIFYGVDNIFLNLNVSIGRNSLFSAENGLIKIGENTSFNSNVFINSSVCGEILIGNNCLIGPNVVMRTAGHNFERADIPIRNQGHICKNIMIEDDVWLGANVVVLGGVTIGKGCVIGAGSVVTKNIEAYSIAVGVPAKVIKNRLQN
jgi:galactoside O-acetyltransferase